MTIPPIINPEPPPSPAPMPGALDRWYLPSWGERFKLMGWRLLYFVPVFFLAGILILLPFSVFCGWKLLVIAVAVPITAVMNSAKKVIRLRKDPFCIHCGYGLTGLPDGHICPECGIQFWLVEIDDYRRDPYWFIQRRRNPQPLPRSGAMIEAGPRKSPKSTDGT